MSPLTVIHTVPETIADKQPAIFLLRGMGSSEEDLPQLVQDFKGSHHISSLRGPIVLDPGYTFFTITRSVHKKAIRRNSTDN